MDAFDLLDKLSQGASIQEILDIASENIGNPFLVCDSRFRILFMSKEDNLDMPLWQKAKLEGYISEAVLADMKRESVLEKLQNTNIPIEALLPNGYHSVRVALRQRGSYCGFVGMYDYHHPFLPEDQNALIMIGKALSILTTDHPDFSITEKTERESLLFQLLCCQTKEEAEFVEKRMAISLSTNLAQLICVRPRITALLPLSRLKDMMPQCYIVSVLYRDQIVLLLPIGNQAADTLRILQSFCDKHHLVMGISTAFSELSFIPTAYMQAKACFYHANEHTKFEDVISDEIRRLCLTQLPEEYFIHPIFRKIQAYDREYLLNYLQTLMIYLDHHGSLQNTAEALNIHYNTMKHRLGVIEEIAGIRLRDDDTLKRTLMVSKLFVSAENKY